MDIKEDKEGALHIVLSWYSSDYLQKSTCDKTVQENTHEHMDK